MTVSATEIRLAAMDLLARREHSVSELRDKLSRRFRAPELLDKALAELGAEGLQSDSRYAEMYLRSRAGRGYGQLRIRQEMRQKGLSDSDIQRAFEDCGVDWLERLQDVAERKFGMEPAADFTEKARRARFLQYRGFSPDQIREILD